MTSVAGYLYTPDAVSYGPYTSITWHAPITSPAACAALCDDDATCLSFDWCPGTDMGDCNLNKDTAATYPAWWKCCSCMGSGVCWGCSNYEKLPASPPPPSPPPPLPPSPPLPSPPCWEATEPVLLAQSTRCVAPTDAVITAQSECEAAAAAIGKVWVKAVNTNTHIYGCFIHRGDSENSVYFNSKADSTTSTSNINKPICHRALCPAPSPPPFVPPPPIAPPPPAAPPLPCKAYQADACAEWDTDVSTRCRASSQTSWTTPIHLNT